MDQDERDDLLAEGRREQQDQGDWPATNRQLIANLAVRVALIEGAIVELADRHDFFAAKGEQWTTPLLDELRERVKRENSR